MYKNLQKKAFSPTLQKKISLHGLASQSFAVYVCKNLMQLASDCEHETISNLCQLFLTPADFVTVAKIIKRNELVY